MIINIYKIVARINFLIGKSIIFLIGLYKKYISPMLGNHCRFNPSCSVYMIECIKRYGIAKGMARGILRICRCHPFSKAGHDPVS